MTKPILISWCKEQRLKWIGEMLYVYGFINRGHLERKFRISTPQASADLQEYKRMYPDAIEYDRSMKHYTSPVMLRDRMP